MYVYNFYLEPCNMFFYLFCYHNVVLVIQAGDMKNVLELFKQSFTLNLIVDKKHLRYIVSILKVLLIFNFL